MNPVATMSDSRAPRVTVLMSTHNSAATLGPAVESILEQTFDDFVLVVYEDGSTDASRAVLDGFKDPRLEVRALENNRGLSANLADGVARANTEYIARMDADDIAMPTRLAEQVAFLDSNPTVDVLGTNVVFFDDTGTETLGIQPANHEEIALRLFFGFTMMHPTIMMRASALRHGGWNYDPEFTYSQDFDLWSRMLPHHRFANLQRPLLRLREHPGKISRAKREVQQTFTNRIRERQLRRIMPDIDATSVDIFARAARGELLSESADLMPLHDTLLRLIECNELQRTYDPDAFAQAAAAFFRGQCRQLLKDRDPTGLAYWRSALRQVAPSMRPRELIGLLAHSALTSVPWR